MTEEIKRRGKKRKMYRCGTPDAHCFGTSTRLNQAMGVQKIHISSVEAFKCYSRYLIKSGYTQIGSREFAAPDGGPIRVLTKKSRFGAILRPGKEGRSMADKWTGGVIISM